MDTHYTFSSTLFSPTTGELNEEHDDYINPDVFAKELADYMERELLKHGYKIKFRCAEDWGHWLELEHEGAYTLAICCSNASDFDNGETSHRVFTHPDKPFIRKWFRKVDVRTDIERLSLTVKSILVADQKITNVQLETDL